MKKLNICFLFILCLFITGCGEPKTLKATSLDTFKNVAINNSFIVSDTTEDYSDADYIVGSMKATYDNIEIEMVNYSDIESAKKVQDKQIESFNLLKSSGASEKKVDGDNYYKYVLISNGRYMITTRVDNTLVFCKALLENKETVEKIYSELGY